MHISRFSLTIFSALLVSSCTAKGTIGEVQTEVPGFYNEFPDSIDVMSFESATVSYPNDVTVPVGRYIAGEIRDSVAGNRNIREISMDSFEMKCVARGALLPTTHCTGVMVVNINCISNDHAKSIRSEIDDLKIGAVYLRDRLFGLKSGEQADPIIKRHVLKAVDALLRQYRGLYTTSKDRC